MQRQQARGSKRWQRRAIAAAVASLAGLAGHAGAFEIDTGNPDLALRWDNTVRYNAGVRAQSQDNKILNDPNLDDGDRNFSNGSPVTSRFDVLSEFDVIWQRKYGARVSAALWWDPAYNSLDNTNTATANTLVNGLPVAGQLTPFTKRYAQGASGEWLDAFVFANFDVGDVPVSVKLGQHTVYWGESLLGNGGIHGISYSQNSLDLFKALSTPGVELKELFRPRGGVTVQAQLTQELALAGQWFYNWQAIRVPESGSYLTVNDAFLFGGDSLIIGPNPLAAQIPGAPAFLRAWNVNQIHQSRYSGSLGDFGVSAKWSPTWLDGTLGFYYRNATDIIPQVLLTPGVSRTPVPAAACSAIGGIPLPGNNCIINPSATNPADLTTKGKFGTYQYAWGDNIHMYGLSLAKQIGGVSIGAELSYRQNMPLVSEPVVVLPAPLAATTPGAIATTAIPSKGTPGALGDTYHGLVNVLGVIPKTALFDTADWMTELTWMQWSKVTQNEPVFKGRSGYNEIDRVSKNYWGLAINFTPKWFQVWPGVDLLAPLSWAQGISGNAAVMVGGNEGAGTYSAGIAADIFQRYRVTLAYTGYYGDTAANTANPNATVFNGINASLADRGWVSLTFKTTF